MLRNFPLVYLISVQAQINNYLKIVLDYMMSNKEINLNYPRF